MSYLSAIEPLESRIAPASVFNVGFSRGTLTISGGATDDNITVSSSGIGANVAITITANGVGDSIVFNGASVGATKAFSPADTAAISKININLGNGANAVEFTSGLAADGFTQAISYTGGINADTLTFTDVISSGSLTAKLGAGDDHVSFKEKVLNEVQFGKAAAIDLGPGTNSVTTDLTTMQQFAPQLDFLGGLTITGGDGADTVHLGTPSAHPGKVVVGKALIFNGGKGANDFDIFGDSVSLSRAAIKSADITKAFAPSIIALNTVNADGGITIAAPGAEVSHANQFDLEGSSVRVAGGLNYLGGALDDTVNIGAAVNSLATIIGGKVAITAKDGTNVTNIGNGDAATPGTLNIGGALVVTGGLGTDTLAVEGSIGSVTGSISAVLGKGIANVSVVANDLHVGGLLVKSAETGTATDSLTLAGVTLTKAATALLGAGVSTVSLDDVNALDRFTLATGGGEDQIHVETSAARTGQSHFFGVTSIDAGLGVDSVLIGDANTPAATAAVFLAPLTVNFGTGGATDSLNITANNIFLPGIVPVIKNH